MPDTVEFTEEAVKEYLDRNIRHWRASRDGSSEMYDAQIALHYIDAYQTIRLALFGEMLPLHEQ